MIQETPNGGGTFQPKLEEPRENMVIMETIK